MRRLLRPTGPALTTPRTRRSGALSRLLLSMIAFAVGGFCLTACNGSEAAAPSDVHVASPVGTSTRPSTGTPVVTPGRVSTSRSGSVSGSISPSSQPDTTAGAQAFGAFYIQRLNLSYRTADATKLTGLSSDSCATCRAFGGAALKLSAAGNHHGGDVLRIKRTFLLQSDDDVHVVGVDVEQRAVPVLDSRGTILRSTKPGAGVFIFTMSYRGRWIISRIQTVVE